MPMLNENQEKEEKKESLFLKYEPENNLIIKSNLFKITCHYIKSLNKSVACHINDCAYCIKGFARKFEYNYFVNLNGKDAVMDIKPSVFFAISNIERASKKDKRQISWLVIKTGTGLDTEYTISKDDNLALEDIEKAEAELEDFNQKLQGICEKTEQRLETAYEENIDNVSSIEKPFKKKEVVKEDIEEEPVVADDIPF